MSDSKKTVRYQRGYIEPINKGDQTKARGSLELWVNSVDAPATAGNGKSYMRLNCSGTFAKSSGIPYALGDVMNENGTLFVRVTVFEPMVEFVDKMGLGKGSRIQVYGTFNVSEFTKKDGTPGKNVECVAQKIEKKWPLADGKGEQFGGYVNRLNVDECGKAYGSLAMYLVKPVEIKKTSAANEVGEVRLSGRFQNNSGIPYALGDDILDPKDGHLFVSASAWSYALDSFKKLNLQKGALIQVYGHFEVREYPRSDGTIGKDVTCRDIKKFEVLSFGKKDDNAAPAANPAPAAPAAAPAPVAAPVDEDDGFQAPASFGDIVVPF